MTELQNIRLAPSHSISFKQCCCMPLLLQTANGRQCDVHARLPCDRLADRPLPTCPVVAGIKTATAAAQAVTEAGCSHWDQKSARLALRGELSAAPVASEATIRARHKSGHGGDWPDVIWLACLQRRRTDVRRSNFPFFFLIAAFNPSNGMPLRSSAAV